MFAQGVGELVEPAFKLVFWLVGGCCFLSIVLPVCGWWVYKVWNRPPSESEATPSVSCGETVGKYALTCPHCGTSYTNRLWWLLIKWIIGAVVVVLILIGLGALFKDCGSDEEAEVLRPRSWEDDFFELDRNGDHKLSRDEYETGLGGLPPNLHKFPQFESIDLDKDDQVDKDEYREWYERFNEIDGLEPPPPKGLPPKPSGLGGDSSQ